MVRNHSLAELIEAHHRLDTPIQEHRENFLSDWNVEHPFVREFLTKRLWKLLDNPTLESGYVYFDEQREVSDAICEFHASADGLRLQNENVIAGPGSTSLLTAFCLWLVQRKTEEVFYVPPLYYTMHFVLRALNIRARPISGRQAFEPDFVLRLPNKQIVLLLTDPVWFAGKRTPQHHVNQIANWQRETGSLVLVDGSFQYMQWSGSRSEFTSALDPEKTFRVISPTKSLAIPSFRFAYLLMPKRFRKSFLFLYENIVGSASIADLIFAKRALNVLISAKSNHMLTDFLQKIYESLVAQQFIKTEIIPECGYFTFANVTSKLRNQTVMGGEYFELKRYPNYARVNLLKAHAVFLNGRAFAN